ncbi:MAG: hypothetical protein AB201_00960 [Parcubacteria bacterium C7867-006]|nr:MAG: hypothetical protein AB201_00960 [Parcubacteria bacterium C7867-006]
MKKISIFVSAVLILSVGYLVFYGFKKGENKVDSYKNATYTVEGNSVKLVNGLNEIPSAPGSSSKVVTRYFGNEVSHDFDGDGRDDIAFLLTQNAGGSGTFYYLVVALNKEDGYVGGHATIIGDRIAPQTTEIDSKGFIVVNYADRKPGESFSTQPSVGKSLWFKFDPTTMQLGVVVQNFEGEADPSKMTLNMKTWNWVKTIYNDGKVITPKKDVFTLTFKGNQFSAKTDCNGVGGEYTVNSGKISFDKMMSTMMYCDGSQESDFSKMIGEVSSYIFTSKGELILEFKMDSGSMVFK